MSSAALGPAVLDLGRDVGWLPPVCDLLASIIDADTDAARTLQRDACVHFRRGTGILVFF